MRRNIRLKAWLLLTLFVSEMITSSVAFALGSGPSQPEMASFTPAGTTEMVDPFTGDFSYNIPLMDVEGYPVNIAYNSGVTMEQEASWVGLGWNLNVGTINRSVRGLPDDFRGEKIDMETSMKPMRIIKFGGSIVAELAGNDKAKGAIEAGLTLIHNNYKGFGLSYNTSISSSIGPISGNVGVDVNSLDGTTFNSNLGVSLDLLNAGNGSLSFGANLGSGFNTRTGQTTLSLGTTAGYQSGSSKHASNLRAIFSGRSGSGPSSSVPLTSTSLLPIGMNTYTPFPTLKMEMGTLDFTGTLGAAGFTFHPGGRIFGSVTVQKLQQSTTSTKAYGYFYTEEAGEEDLRDFNREKQAPLNQTTTNLSPTSFTYDVFSVSGQGVSGMFRPFRNDIGVLSEAAYELKSSDAKSIGGELGFGWLFHAGLSYNQVNVKAEYGPWESGNTANNYKFSIDETESLYEKVYFKSAGDKAASDESYFESIGAYEPLAFNLQGDRLLNTLSTKDGLQYYGLSQKQKNKRDPRAKVFTYLTAEKAAQFALDKIRNVSGAFYDGAYSATEITRTGGGRELSHLSEIRQINPNGEQYVYGIPAYNHTKKEVNYTTASVTPSIGVNRIAYNGTEASTSNDAGVDNHYSSTTTPAYAHSFLLTAKLSEDYQDVTGDGVSPDDIGNAYKFDYTRTSTAYKWRTPYSGVSFMEGYKSNKLDQKASYTYGEKEMWYLHSIQSKNQVAEFYISEREDALAVAGESGGKPGAITTADRSFKLDSIVLFNKLDRLKNKAAATPIKKVAFTYDYSLCKNVENQENANAGKLTLKKIEISYGRSEYGRRSPYTFTYSTVNPNYNPDNMDRWGNYKPYSENPGTMNNGDFPYVPENLSDSINTWASAWSLTGIRTPFGGEITVDYEADDYAYVQDKVAMQMFPVVGAGDSPTFTSNNTLYGNNFLYIEKPAGISSEASVRFLKKVFFGNEDRLEHMYFKFLTALGSENEYAMGYATAVKIGKCTNSDNLYIQLAPSSPNPISRAAWGMFRQNISDVLYEQPNIKDTGLEALIRGIKANINDFRRMFTGVEEDLKNRGIANTFVTSKSFIRLQSPTKTKQGGGSRVKQIQINDRWKDLSGEGRSATYGQEYFYTTTDEFKREISSGVASYEPMVGNDENPFRIPTYYIAQAAAGHVPAIKDYQESPFGETFLPSATVGYSKIIVRNIHRDNGRTSKGATAYQFYTAKDFPARIEETPIQKVNHPASKTNISFPFVNNKSEAVFAASQGYSIVLNDMHGKPLSTKNFRIIESSNTPILISGEKYNYQIEETASGKRLNNTVEVLTADGYVKEKLLGVEVDLAIENRRVIERSTTIGAHGNYDSFLIFTPFFILYFNIITGGGNSLTDGKDSRFQVLTKVIQEYGIIESVESFTDQYHQTTYNRLYDETTGDVMLTETKDEFNKNEFQLKLPAYQVEGQELMGPAYQNLGIELFVRPKQYDVSCNADYSAFTVNKPEWVKNGDEVLYKDNLGNYERAWLVLDEDNRYNEPLDQCTTITAPFTPKYKRFFSHFGRQTNSLVDTHVTPFVRGQFKKQLGSILSDVKIYHLNSSWADTYDTALDSLVNYSNCEIVWPRVFFATNNYPEQMNHLYHSSQCHIAENFFYNTFDTLYEQPTIFHPSNNPDLSEPLQFQQEISEFAVFFDLTDTLYAELELLKTHVSYNSIVDSGLAPDNPQIFYRNFKVDEEEEFVLRNNPCLDFDDYTYHLRDYPYVSAATHRPKLVYNGWPISNYSQDSNSVFNVRSSYASFRIKDKASFQNYLAKEESMYLVEYQIRDRLSGDTSSVYYVESGRGYEDIPGQTSFEAYCDINEYDNGVSAQDPCEDNFRLIDEDGDPIAVTNVVSIKVLRSAYRNRLMDYTGIIRADKNPMKIDGSGKFIGFTENASLIKLYAANSTLYKEKAAVYHNYPSTDNPFLNATEGAHRADSLLAYKSSRAQTSGIEAALDGYMEDLPDLWAELPCYKGIFPPDYTAGGEASGWKFIERATRFCESGAPLESLSNLGIYSAQVVNAKGMIDMVAANSKYQNIAFDGFEDYFNFGRNNAQNKAAFRFAQSSTPTSSDTLINNGNEYYVLSNYSEGSLVEGVAHSGDYSLFANREANPSSSLTINYTESSLNSLEQLELGDAFVSQAQSVVVNENTKRTEHLAAFKADLSATVNSSIDNALSNAPASHTFTLNTSDSVANFKPESGTYVLSIWMKEILESGTAYAGLSPEVIVENNGNYDTLKASGPAIDGWRKIEGTFAYDAAYNLNISLVGGKWGAFFDDLRIHPKESNVATFIYDRYSGRLKAKLDENNYAVFYEYDDAGIPSQLRRETDQGILTISESRQSMNKRSQ
jgi:hypothetical protein